jgi:dTDP-4-amino-4,6-dideoxygalactose transaminase
MTTGEGGMFVTRHRAWANSVERLKAFGVDRSNTKKNMAGTYDVVALGLNYRMSELQAALGRQQLRNLNENLKRRHTNFTKLKSYLAGIEDNRVVDATDEFATSSHYCLSVCLDGKLRGHRDEVIIKLRQAGVGTSVYYPNPVPRMTYYRNKYGYEEESYPNAIAISDFSIALPVGPHVTQDDIEYIANSLQQATKGVKI